MDLLKLKFLRPLAPYASLLLRIVVGIIMVNHGWQKFSGGAEGVAGFFSGLGIPMASVMAWVVIIVELVGGICVILGILPRLWSLLFAITMLVAIVLAKIPNAEGFLDGYELELLLMVAALYFASTGGGSPAVGPMIGLSDD